MACFTPTGHFIGDLAACIRAFVKANTAERLDPRIIAKAGLLVLARRLTLAHLSDTELPNTPEYTELVTVFAAMLFVLPGGVVSGWHRYKIKSGILDISLVEASAEIMTGSSCAVVNVGDDPGHPGTALCIDAATSSKYYEPSQLHGGVVLITDPEELEKPSPLTPSMN